MEGINGAAM